jgi:hypothetical protein
MTWGLEMWPFENGHTHYTRATGCQTLYGAGAFCVKALFSPAGVCGSLDFGRIRVKVLPCPEVLVTVMAPWWTRAKALARLRPRPVPG